MDGRRFDDLTKAFAVGASRRAALRTVAGTAVGGLLALLGVERGGAQTCRAAGRSCNKNANCCSAFCDTANADPFKRKRCACPPGTENCGGVCKTVENYQTDVANCGQCGNRCSAPICNVATCTGGSCGTTPAADGANCPGGICCDGLCVDPQNDDTNCGICGTACESGTICLNGSCCSESLVSLVCGNVCCDRVCDESEGICCYEEQVCSDGAGGEFCCTGTDVCCGGAGNLTCVSSTRACTGNQDCACADEVCAGGTCCPPSRACGSVCCSVGSVCREALGGCIVIIGLAPRRV